VLKEDVLARLTFRLEVPDLNARKEDIPLLARHLLGRILSRDSELAISRAEWRDGGGPTLSVALVRDLLAHNYTTHARELEAHLWRALETSGKSLGPVPDEKTQGSRELASGADTLRPPGPECPEGSVVEAVQRCLDAHNGVIENAWRDLGLSSRYALTRLIRKHGIVVHKRLRG
jgi:DNA-binding NtrC family response regulator